MNWVKWIQVIANKNSVFTQSHSPIIGIMFLFSCFLHAPPSDTLSRKTRVCTQVASANHPSRIGLGISTGDWCNIYQILWKLSWNSLFGSWIGWNTNKNSVFTWSGSPTIGIISYHTFVLPVATFLRSDMCGGNHLYFFSLEQSLATY